VLGRRQNVGRIAERKFNDRRRNPGDDSITVNAANSFLTRSDSLKTGARKWYHHLSFRSSKNRGARKTSSPETGNQPVASVDEPEVSRSVDKITDKTCHQTTIQLPISPNVCFCTTWGKRKERNITFLSSAI